MNQTNYIDIINEETPCEGCIHEPKCATQRHACDAFAVYVNNGQVNWEISRLPTRRIYTQTMRLGDGGSSLIRRINKKLRKELA